MANELFSCVCHGITCQVLPPSLGFQYIREAVVHGSPQRFRSYLSLPSRFACGHLHLIYGTETHWIAPHFSLAKQENISLNIRQLAAVFQSL